jgi:hypothetical protein
MRRRKINNALSAKSHRCTLNFNPEYPIPADDVTGCRHGLPSLLLEYNAKR